MNYVAASALGDRLRTSVNGVPRVREHEAARTDGAGRNSDRLPVTGEWAGGAHRDAARASGRIKAGTDERQTGAPRLGSLRWRGGGIEQRFPVWLARHSMRSTARGYGGRAALAGRHASVSRRRSSIKQMCMQRGATTVFPPPASVLVSRLSKEIVVPPRIQFPVTRPLRGPPLSPSVQLQAKVGANAQTIQLLSYLGPA